MANSSYKAWNPVFQEERRRPLVFGILGEHARKEDDMPLAIFRQSRYKFDEQSREEEYRHAEYEAFRALGYLLDVMDPAVADAFLSIAAEHAERAGLTKALNPQVIERQVTTEVVVEKEVVPKFRIMDPDHPCFEKAGELLYVEDDEVGVWYLWIDGKPVRVLDDQVVKQ